MPGPPRLLHPPPPSTHSKLREIRVGQCCPLQESALFKGVKQIFEDHFSTSATTQRTTKLVAEIIDPRVVECTHEAIDRRFTSGEFECYSKKGSRKLGADLKSRTPETTLVPDLVILPLVRDTLLPLEDVRHVER